MTSRFVAEGEQFTREMFDIRSPGIGLQPMYIEQLIGNRSARDIEAGDFVYESDLSGDRCRPRRYYFDRPIGVPVRYHDFHEITSGSTLDFVEFHLSAGDLDSCLSEYLQVAHT